ncbi:MAG: nitroreductase family protein [Candidatus Hodarchaeota archaeon]
MDFFDVVRKRRSIRAYLPKQVDDEKIKKILNAARLAPTAANKQPYKLVVIKNPKTKLDFVRQKAVHQAPVVIAIFIDESQAWFRNYDNKNFAFVDGAIVFEHIILAAVAQGLATVWIANVDPSLMKKALDLQDKYHFLALTPIGYPAEEPKKTSRKPKNELIKHV